MRRRGVIRIAAALLLVESALAQKPAGATQMRGGVKAFSAGSLLPGTEAYRLAEQQAQRQHHQLIPTRQLEDLPANASAALAAAGGRPPANATEAVNMLGRIPRNAAAAFRAARMFAGSLTGQSKPGPAAQAARPQKVQAGITQTRQLPGQLRPATILEQVRPPAAAVSRPTLASFSTAFPSYTPVPLAGRASFGQEAQHMPGIGKRKAEFSR